MHHPNSTSPAIVSYRRQHELSQDIQLKKQKISHLSHEITRIKTKNATKELEVWKLEDEVVQLRKLYASVKANIEKLHEYEEDSLRTLDNHYELGCKEIDADLNRKLLSLKERVTREVESRIQEAKAKSAETREALVEDISRLSAELSALKTELELKLKVLQDQSKKQEQSLRQASDVELARLRDSKSQIDATIVSKRAQLKDAQELHEKLESSSNKQLQQKLESLASAYSEKEAGVLEIQRKVQQVKDRLKAAESVVSTQKNLVEKYRQETSWMQQRLPLLEIQRRELHNKLQELKGNIRVFCRVKPAEAASCASFDIPSTEEFNSNGKQVLTISSSTPSSSFSGKDIRSSQYSFEFDKIFDQRCSNSEVFSEIDQLVQSSLDGLNVCVFAYGQTGSGKTWTMSHPEDGMISLSLKRIFCHISDLKEQGWEYSIAGQFVEIYNEQIIDLLSSKTNCKHEIKHDDIKLQTEILNCSTIKLNDENNAIELLTLANANRSTGFTMANSRSSRSHSIFIIKISGLNQKTGQQTEGTLNLVDLAGSERLNVSQARGERLKETQAINKSLSCLADVIYSLSQRQNGLKNALMVHVPYRNSKLTFLLKHSLGGNSKTLMFVNISPLEEHLNETINSLRFAAKVNNTKISS